LNLGEEKRSLVGCSLDLEREIVFERKQKTDSWREMLKRNLVSLEDCWNFPLCLVVNQANAEGLEEGWTELGIVFFPFFSVNV